MHRSDSYPDDSAARDPEVAEAAALLSKVVDLQRQPPLKALQALKLAAERIAVAADDIEAMKIRAYLRGVAAKRELIESDGGQLSAAGLAQRLDVSRETINVWRNENRVLGWKRSMRNYSYPAWQVHRGAILPGLMPILKVFAEKRVSGLGIVDYLLSPSDELGGRPLDLLRKNQFDPVLEHVRRYGEMGT